MVGESFSGDIGDSGLREFYRNDFDAKVFARSYYRQHSDAQAKAFCVDILAKRTGATQILQREVFKHYPNFIDSGNDLEKMEGDLTSLRRCLGKTEYILQSIESASNQLSKLKSFEEKRLAASKSREKDERKQTQLVRNYRHPGSSPLGVGDGGAVLGEEMDASNADGDLEMTLQISRFKNIQALQCDENYELKWLVEAPDRLHVLLHFTNFQEAVKVIKRVRAFDLDGYQNDLETRVGNGDKSIDTSILDDRLWALHFSKRMVERLADGLVKNLINNLENTLPKAGEPNNKPRTPDDDDDDEGDQMTKEEQMHPVKLLQQLDMEDVACRAFLRGRRSYLKQVTDEIIFGPLATDAQECILQLAKSTFKGILDTNLEFQRLFLTSKTKRDNNKESSMPTPNNLLSCLLVWNRHEVGRYCTNFVRFLLPGCKDISYMHSEEAQNGHNVMMTNGQSDKVGNGPEGKCETSEDGLKCIPFPSERSAEENFVSLSNDEWVVLGRCLRWTLLMCRRFEKSGISINFMITSQLQEPLNTALQSIFVQVERKLRFYLSSERWQTEQLRVETNGSDDKEGNKGNDVLSLTTSGQKTYELVHDLIHKIKRIYSTSYSTSTVSLDSNIVVGVKEIVVTYLHKIVHAFGAWPSKIEGSRERFEETVFSSVRRGESYTTICKRLGGDDLTLRDRRVITVLMGKPFSIPQQLGMIANILYISSDLTTRIRLNFEKLFKRQILPLRELEESSADMGNEGSPLRMVCDAFVTRQSISLLEDVLQWSHFDYSSSLVAGGDLSANFKRLAEAILDLKRLVVKHIGDNHSCGLDLIASITEHILTKLFADGVPSAIFGPVEPGTHHKRLENDLNLILRLPESFGREPSEEAIQLVHKILEKVK